ncbi:5-oxoprolinase subunit PxpB [Saccharospirillum alexandrii]|uniref:5-oxoprolinase subunit PxpB n=1 Tax=Saccharospirillum alexandrii TaxID=2448477 RepID=UPI000FDA9010|nr:5-oxoprolinase subunit PxpB [Saccharospirillum alexandrii]
MRVHAVSEQAVQVEFGRDIDEALIPVIARAVEAIRAELGAVVIDLIPSYTTLLCFYDYNQVDSQWMVREIARILSAIDTDESGSIAIDGRLVEIPVWYDLSVGYDLDALAQQKSLTIAEIVQLHSARDYQVFAIGFNPGFGFLGALDDRLVTPRHSTPRRRVPQGSVGIADAQTAVYPMASPGGWNIIGRTPRVMFDSSGLAGQAALLNVGDRVRFVPISRSEFIERGGQLDD